MLEAHLKSITKCHSAVMFLLPAKAEEQEKHPAQLFSRATELHAKGLGARASNKYFISMPAPQRGLMHNVTSAMSLQVQLRSSAPSSTVSLWTCLSTRVSAPVLAEEGGSERSEHRVSSRKTSGLVFGRMIVFFFVCFLVREIWRGKLRFQCQ